MSIVLIILLFFKVFHKLYIIINFMLKKVSSGKCWPLEMCSCACKISVPVILPPIMVKFGKISEKKRLGYQPTTLPSGSQPVQLRGGGLWFNLCAAAFSWGPGTWHSEISCPLSYQIRWISPSLVGNVWLCSLLKRKALLELVWFLDDWLASEMLVCVFHEVYLPHRCCGFACYGGEICGVWRFSHFLEAVSDWVCLPKSKILFSGKITLSTNRCPLPSDG